jgi:hypothetical protein
MADAIGRPTVPWQRVDFGAVLEALAKAPTEPAPAVGLGEEYSFGTVGTAGSPMAFPTAGAPQGRVNQ